MDGVQFYRFNLKNNMVGVPSEQDNTLYGMYSARESLQYNSVMYHNRGDTTILHRGSRMDISASGTTAISHTGGWIGRR